MMLLMMGASALAETDFSEFRDVIPHSPFDPSALLHEQIVPLGFSPGSHFAYLRYMPDEAIGCFLWRFQIINMVTDEVVFSQQWSQETCGQITSHEHLLARLGSEFNAHLEQYGISPSVTPLHAFPLQHSGTHYMVSLRSSQPVVNDEQVTVPLEVLMSASQKGQKSIGQRSLELNMSMAMSWGHEVVGYLSSPHERRVVVVVREVHRGYEGPPHVEHLTLFGASLEQGF